MHPLVAAEYAKVPEGIRQFVPIEGIIDQLIRNLCHSHVKNGGWTAEEKSHFDELTMERTRRMMPPRIRPRRRR